MEKNFILQEVIDELVEPTTSLSGPLLRLQYFGMLTKNQELLDFCDFELNGYPTISGLPEYRKKGARLEVGTTNGFVTQTLIVPLTLIEDAYQEALRYVPLTESVVVLEQWAQNQKKENGLAIPVPVEFYSSIQRSLNKGYINVGRITGATLTAQSKIALEALTTVRSRLLSLVVKIGEKFGYDVQIDSFKRDLDNNNQTINNYMTNITNTGHGNVTNTGNNSSIEANISINIGDLDSLKNKLKELGVEPAEIKELEEIVTAETADKEKKVLGEKAQGWLSKMYQKSLKAGSEVAIHTSGHVLAGLIMQYYGIHG